MRWTAGTVTVVVAMLAAAATETLAYRDTDSTLFRNAGLRTLVLCLVIIVVGALSQAPIAARRRAAIRPGLLAAAAFVAYLLLVAGCAAGTVGQEGPLAGGSRWSPERLYQAVVFCLLGGPVLMALGGFIYVAPDDPTPLRHRIWMSTLVGWVFAVPLAVWLGFRLVA